MHKFTTVKQQQPNSLENRLSKQIISDISRRLINLNRDAYFHVCVCDPLCRWLKCRWFFSTPSKLVDHDIRQNVCIRFFFPFLLCRAKCKHKQKWFQFLPTLLWIAYLTFSGPFDINNKCNHFETYYFIVVFVSVV